MSSEDLSLDVDPASDSESLLASTTISDGDMPPCTDVADIASSEQLRGSQLVGTFCRPRSSCRWDVLTASCGVVAAGNEALSYSRKHYVVGGARRGAAEFNANARDMC